MPDTVSRNEIPVDDVSGSEESEEVTVFPAEFPYGLVRSSNKSYAQWQDSFTYSIGDLVSYDGKVYECIYAHTSNLSWLPDSTPTLWKEVSVIVSGSDDSDIGFDSADMEALVNVCMEINQNVVTGMVAVFIMLGFLIGIILVRGLGGFLKGV